MNRLPVIVAAALLCGACSKSAEPPRTPDAPKPKIEAPTGSGVTEVKPMPAPKNDSAAPGAADRTGTNAKSAMTKEEQSASMPMPGQAHDHSIPSTKPASPAQR